MSCYFLTRPARVFARRVDETNGAELAAWACGVYRTDRIFCHVAIQTMDGAKIAAVGDYVIRDCATGRFTTCKGSDFESKYMPEVESAPSPTPTKAGAR